MSRGSEWRRWDLHIHTPCSFHNNYKISDEERKEYGSSSSEYTDDLWDKYIDSLERVDKNIKVIGITDYFSLEGYKKVLNYRKKGRLQNFDLILPNIEFRVDLKDYKFNYHIIFNNELDPDLIEEYFLKSLKIFNYETEKVRLSKEEIKKLGSKIIENESIKGTPYTVGCKRIFVSLKQMNDILRGMPSIFDGNYISILVAKDWNSINGRGKSVQTKILKESHAVFSSNPDTINYMLGRKTSTEKFKNKYGTLKPCLHGSDAHSFEELCKPDLDRYCWIKADPTFEGLKQVIYEPESRVNIGRNKPGERKNIYSLKSVEISDSHIHNFLSLNEGVLELNKDLIVVTGGKGSGKTALLDLIANCYNDRCLRSGKDINSFIQRIEEYNPNLKVKLRFLEEEEGYFEKKINEKKFFEASEIGYLPQGNIEYYSEDRKKLDKEIMKIIFKNKDVIDKGYKKEYDNLELEIWNINKDIDSKIGQINNLKKETSDELLHKTENERNIIKGNLKNKENELSEISKTVDEDINKKISLLKSEEDKLHVKNSKLWSLKNGLDKLNKELLNFKEENQSIVTELNKNLKEAEIEATITQIDPNSQIDSINNALSIINDVISIISNEIESKKKEIKKLSGVEDSYLEVIKEVDDIKTHLTSLETQIKKIEDKKKEIKNIKEKIIDKYGELLSKHFDQKDHYKTIITAFSEDTDDILKGIIFKSYIHFDKSSFIEDGFEIFDRRKKRTIQKDLETIASNVEKLIKNENLDGIKRDVRNIFNEEEFLKERKTVYDLYHWVLTDYFSLSTEISFNGRPMDKLSMGQKGTILLKIFLAEGDYPLIIDQPEDNLDNRFIYKELVKAFRDAKKRRQIIIATNNANLVVNTDAEQIIVAEFKDNKIYYKPGSLENQETRNNIMPILEGGEIAFREREKKYGI